MRALVSRIYIWKDDVRIGIMADDLMSAMDCDTAAAVLRTLAASSIRLIGEIEPSIPVNRIDAPRPIGLITKAGGFGGPDSIVLSAGRLRGESIGIAA